ncbi:MAG: pyruvate dehydrogenase complex dihydrolipoamide acetyltransferase, partial [Magnetospirillum sp.]
MPVQILMPALSPTMTEGNLAKWLKNEGDAVKSGDIICEIETDKATMEFEAADEGVLGKILVPGGTSGVKVNQPIAVLLLDGEDATAIVTAAAVALAPAAAVETVPVAIPSAAPAPAVHSGDRVFASPLAKRIAKDGNVDLKSVKGSGPHGRIVKADVEAAIMSGP